MTPDEISNWVLSNFKDVHPKASWGETSFFVNPEEKLPSGAYFATLKESNGDNDKASDLDRDGVFRLNFGPGKKPFEDTFGPTPERPSKGSIIIGPWDFNELDKLMPHPIYGWMGILNPSAKTFKEIEPYMNLAYQKANKTALKRLEKL